MADAYNLTGPSWASRIVGHAMVPPEDLLANPFNHRIHSKFQQDIVAGLLDEVGWVDKIKVNVTTGHMLDGHLRVQLALRKGEPVVPVDYVELTEDEEKKVLLLFDWVTGLASNDKTKIDELLRSVQTADEALQQALAELAQGAGLYLDGQEVDFDEFGDVDNDTVLYRVVVDGLDLSSANELAAEIDGHVEQYRVK